MLIKNKILPQKWKTTAFWQTQNSGKIMAFSVFDENHGFRDFRKPWLSTVPTHKWLTPVANQEVWTSCQRQTCKLMHSVRAYETTLAVYYILAFSVTNDRGVITGDVNSSPIHVLVFLHGVVVLLYIRHVLVHAVKRRLRTDFVCPTNVDTSHNHTVASRSTSCSNMYRVKGPDIYIQGNQNSSGLQLEVASSPALA